MKSLTQLSIILTVAIVIAAPWADAQTDVSGSVEKTITILGSVGVAGVVLKGLPGEPKTDENGVYSVRVEAGWSGTVTPLMEGFIFEPPLRRYNGVQEDRKLENYVASAKTLTISGSTGLPGVIMRGLRGDFMMDVKGVYRVVRVPYGWSGVLTPERTGYLFDPPSRAYDHITADQTGQDYGARQTQVTGTVIAQDVLVVPTKAVNATEFAETAQDMRVMLQILREKASEPSFVRGRSVLPDYGPLFGSSGRGTEALYIQGYAAMFMIDVDFPLARSSEPNAADGRGTPREGDPVWQRAREKLSGSGQSGSSDGTNPVNFDQFKENLIRALRHAANIRHLDPNEQVILTIISSGRPVSVPSSSPYGSGGGMGAYGGGYGGMGGFGGYGGGIVVTDSTSGYIDSGEYTGFSMQNGGAVMGGGVAGGLRPIRPTAATAGNVLTIQAKMADIDAFAKDQISFDQFNQRARVFSY